MKHFNEDLIKFSKKWNVSPDRIKELLTMSGKKNGIRAVAAGEK